MQLVTPRRLALLPIFTTVLIDMIGVGIVIPVIAPLFLSAHSPFAGIGWSYVVRTLFIGLLAAIYPLMQFFGAPYLGALSDRWGRKPVLVLSLAGTLVGYVFFALAIYWKLVWLLFLSRALDGFTGGNSSTAQSAISDISTPEEKPRNFALTGVAFGLGIIVGPYLGGKLADPSVVHWFTPATPFWFAAILTFLNIILVLWRFKETLRTRLRTPLTFLAGAHNIKRAFSLGNVRVALLVTFLFTAAFNFYTQFFQVLLIQKFSFTESAIGDLYGYAGLWLTIMLGFAPRWASRFWKPHQILPWSLLLMALSLAGLMLPNVTWLIYGIAPFLALGIGLTQPNITTITSSLADEKSQGEILGINQSVNSLAMVIPPVISGLLVAAYVYLPLMIASAAALVSWAIFTFLFKPANRARFAEE